MLAPITSSSMAGFRFSGTLATPTLCNEAESGSLALRLTCSPHEASPVRFSNGARLAICSMGNSQNELLSVHKISQAWPGAPEDTEKIEKYEERIGLVDAKVVRDALR